MDRKHSGRWSQPAYVLAALALGLLWHAAFLVPAAWRGSGPAGALSAPLFMVLALLIAWGFRRTIMNSSRFASDLLLAVALPTFGIAVVSIVLVIAGAIVSRSLDQIAFLFVYPLMGAYAVFTNAWYIIVPMGLLSQFAMKAVARRVWRQDAI
jgi:hypothetical protein